MSAKIEIPNQGDLIQRYQAGETISKLAMEWDIPKTTLRRRLDKLGVREDRRSHRLKTIPRLAAFIARYRAGESVNSLCIEAGVKRFAFTAALQRAGVHTRGQSEAETAKWQQMPADVRSRQVAHAHDAVRGTTTPLVVMQRQAIGRQRKPRTTPVERLLSQWLIDAGFPITPQKAVSCYNIDIAIDMPPIAVECFGGGWHASGHHRIIHEKRFNYLLDQGWHVIIVWIDARRYPLSMGARDYIIAFAKEASRDPSMTRQYRVILGDGQTAPSRSSYLNTRPVIETLGCCFDISGNHHFVTG